MAKQSISERRLLENEAVFREWNEKVARELKDLKEMAEREQDAGPHDNESLKLRFYCECADEDCRGRVRLAVKSYRKIHKDRKQFIVMPHHQVRAIETVVKKYALFYVVEKTAPPPEHPEGLNATQLANA